MLAENSVTKKGCRYFSQREWPRLQEFFTSTRDYNLENKLEEEGISYLCQLKARQLVVLKTGRNIEIQIA